MNLNLPNKLTMLRIFMVPVFLVVLLCGFFSGTVARYAAVGIFVLASLTDWLDGFLARKMNLITNFGKFLDPIADKLLVCAALVAMVELGDLSAWMAIVIISRELIISGFRIIAAEKGSVIAASLWAKIKTVMQMSMIIMTMLAPNFQNDVISAICEFLKWLAIALTVVSAADYLYKNKDVMKDDR